MNKETLVKSVAKETRYTQDQVSIILDSIVGNIKKSMAKNEKVTLIGFGTFSAKFRGASTGYNISTKKPMPIPPMFIPAFKAGDSLRALLKGSKTLQKAITKREE